MEAEKRTITGRCDLILSLDRLDDKKQFTRMNVLALFAQDRDDLSVFGSFDRDLHLHRLGDRQNIALLHGIADLSVNFP